MFKFLELPTECIVNIMNNLDPYTLTFSFNKVCHFLSDLSKKYYIYECLIFNKKDSLDVSHTFVKIFPKKNIEQCIINILEQYCKKNIPIKNLFFSDERIYLKYCHYKINVLKEQDIIECQNSEKKICIDCNIFSNIQPKLIYENKYTSLFKIDNKNIEQYMLTQNNTLYKFEFMWKKFNFGVQKFLHDSPYHTSNFIKNLNNDELFLLNIFSNSNK